MPFPDTNRRWAHRVALRYRAAMVTKQKLVHKFFDELEVEVRLCVGGRSGQCNWEGVISAERWHPRSRFTAA